MLHPLAFDGVNRLTADFDKDTLADFYVRFFDAIQELHAVASRTRRRPTAQDDIERLDLPLVVGSLLLRRPSVGGMEWLRTKASAWWGESTRAYSYALAFVCAHRNAATFDLLQSRTYASFHVWKWALQARTSEESLRRAALALMPPPDDSLRWFSDPDEQAQNTHAAPDLGAIALSLTKHYGHTVSHWLWEVSDDDFWAATCDLNDDADAELSDESRHAKGTWWHRHRSALKRCEDALERDVAAWIESRKPKEASNG